MMRAFAIAEAGQDDPQLMHVPIPRCGPDEILVRVRAVGVGIHDSYFLPTDISFPFPIGIEAAGTIDEVGDSVTGLRIGEPIAVVSSMQVKGGTWAEYAVVRADSLIVPIPDGLSFDQAAAVPVAGNTILRAFHSLPAMPEGSSLFIAGASGAIGTFAIQLARIRGWEVAASASARNHEYLRSLGATMVVDYHDQDWTEQIRRWRPHGVDAAVAVQPRTSAESASIVRIGGLVVSISGDRVAPQDGVSVVGIAYEVDVRDELIEMMGQIAAGRIHLEVERAFPFDDAAEALAKVRTRRARGKTVLTLG